MSSIYERLVVETVRSLGSSSSSKDAGTSNPSDKASCKRLLDRINADEAKLIAEGRPWYEVRASLLQESDKAIIRDLSDMSDHYEIMIPVDLIREDLLCHFGFSRTGIEVEGDLADRIMKAQLLEAFKKQESEASKDSNPPPEERVKEKRKISSSGSDKRSKNKTSSTVGVDKEAGTSPPEQSGIEVTSFITCSVTTTTVAFFQNFAPELDLPVVSSASDQAIIEALTTNFLQIEDVRGISDAEKRSLSDRLAASEASFARLQVEMKRMQEEIEEKIKRMQEEAEETWRKRKEDFLKSSELDKLCSSRALSFFQHGFNGCLAQFRANGYSEAEHPASFLSVLKALEDLPEEGKVESSSSPKK
ncbi:structural maintenance of chromosomes protein 2-2 [Dorcoceras hygrometricum]|uniref:Structural maintenance of chromosomes protein 2-2 n=1 Tax=Dorcoceras hygrometricum TaxID=472368 RepID=A0A2Z7CZ63_9LAMI|nr:structural maintenance of chromosomes protein 2-2 [Dorcoceras hygrometricum]